MSNVIILRLIPTKPVSVTEFDKWISNLTITAYDLTVQDTLGGVVVATATNIAATPPADQPLDLGVVVGSATTIVAAPPPPPAVQLDPNIFLDEPILSDPLALIPVRAPVSTATAVLVMQSQSARFDLRFEITRVPKTHLDKIADTIVEYNLIPHSEKSSDPNFYTDMTPDAYIRIPPLEPTAPNIRPTSNGQPPKFQDVFKAVNMVLTSDDSSTLDALTDALTFQQCTQIAANISWNRSAIPLSTVDVKSGVGSLYTSPIPAIPVADSDKPTPVISAADQTKYRTQFEGQLSAYYSSFNASTSLLSNLVFATSAAVCCERLTSQATLAGLTFPVVESSSAKKNKTDASDVVDSSANTDASVVVVSVPDSTGNVSPPWTVPAPYFYVLGATLPSQILLPQRYQAALAMTENQLLSIFNSAVDNGTLQASIAPVLGGDKVTPAQAARRIVALGSTDGPSKIQQTLIANVIFIPGTNAIPATSTTPAVKGTPASGWLAYTGSDINAFWTTAMDQFHAIYVILVLQAITQGDTDLVTALTTPPPSQSITVTTQSTPPQSTPSQSTPTLPQSTLQIKTVHDLGKTSDDQWTKFFEANPTLLPSFTSPGGVMQRIASFIQRLRKFIPARQPSTSTTVVTATKVSSQPPSASVPTPSVPTPPSFGVPELDVLELFIEHYKPGVDFSKPFDQAALDLAMTRAFPNNPAWQSWVRQALTIIQTLVTMTSTCDSNVQFSVMESLYARGFTTTKSVNILTLGQFERALSGSIAYENAAAIQKQSSISKPSPESSFTPVNPNGSLTNCIPPPNLSPLGLVQYLHEILALKLEDRTLESHLAHRRGNLGSLFTTTENLNTPVPCIDLVNESLEFLGADLKSGSGAVYNSKLSKERVRAVPEYSSPATPAHNPVIYDTLKQCFTSPGLPYPQALDICRSYLDSLGTDRFEAMRHFRKDITELSIDAGLEPPDFQRHLWRLPVRFELALEYLHLSHDEYIHLFSGKFSDVEVLQLLGVDEFTSLTVAEFLKCTGLDYQQFLQLQECEYVPFTRDVGDFPRCEPCGLQQLRISFYVDGDPLHFELHKLFIFIRLWRQLSKTRNKLTFHQLADICNVLELFVNQTVNGDFIRQLAALLMLQNQFNLPWNHSKSNKKINGMQRTPLLALWIHRDHDPVERDWAIESLLGQVEKYAKVRHGSGSGFVRDVRENFNHLSFLAGFTNLDTWHAKPTSTLRFAELLSKICASQFTVGEIIFLFTPETHVLGDDPYNLPDALESPLDPLNVPEDSPFGLWTLRDKLMQAEITDAEEWTWHRIESALRHLTPHIHAEPLRILAEHFFPRAIEHHGHQVKHESRQFRVKLKTTQPLMWNTGDGPFRYDSGTEELWLQLPVSDKQVIKKLREIRQLTNKEISAVQNLYFAPRAKLSPFALLFSDFRHAVHTLVHEQSEEERFRFFQREFSLFHRRCEIIAQHLAEHVAAVTDRQDPESHAVVWQVLVGLLADENRPSQPWETDAGTPPSEFMWDRLSGCAFAALLGLCGTGLLEKFECQSEIVWRSVTNELTFFGHEQNKANSPVPTLIPTPSLTLSPEQDKFASVINGFAIRDDNGHPLGGVQGFCVSWTGTLMVQNPGEYCFYAGAPRPGNDEPDFEHAKHHSWVAILRRGDKTWTVLNHCWAEASEAPGARSSPLWLRRGGYEFEIRFEQRQPIFMDDHIDRLHTGFQLKYTGPDTDSELVAIPRTKLFRPFKNDTLGDGVRVCDSAAAYLRRHFTSTLRDIRRTYQRAFKGVLFAHRFRLSTKTRHFGHQSELSLFLHAQLHFLGASYYRTSASEFSTHRAFFDLNFLPVTDYFESPTASRDLRVDPTLKRQAALFDWWERVFDYCRLRASLQGRQVWMLFHDAAVLQPSLPNQLLQYLDIDVRLAQQVFNYYETSTTVFQLQTSMLTDERWAIRVRQAGRWIQELRKRLYTNCKAETTTPYLWVSDDPNSVFGDKSGNQDLTSLFQEGFQRGNYDQVKRINDGLRERARAALVAYLCDDRVPLPFVTDTFAQSPRDLSDLLLQEVAVGLDKKATRIDNAVSAVRAFVQRSRLGLEPQNPHPKFVETWDARYATFNLWETWKRRELYHENWIEWEELQEARKCEGFRVLESQLRRSIVTIPKSSGLVWWPESTLADTAGLELLQTRERTAFYETSESTVLDGVTTTSSSDGLGLLGRPEFDGQLSWVAPSTDSTDNLPLWANAAVKMGIRFVIVHAATPPAAGAKPQSCGQYIDKFYFWLADSEYFNTKDTPQNAGLGATPPDPTCNWDHPSETLLQWKSRPMVHLFWCRVHFGRFETPRRSTKGFPSVKPSQLSFLYRKSDSLYFGVGTATSPDFRYDMSTDSAHLCASSDFVIPTNTFPLPLNAYPFFIYFEPGAPLMPSTYSKTVAIANTLRSHCRFEESLKWLELALTPIKANNSWGQPQSAVTIRNRSVLLKYLEILLCWAESRLGNSEDAPVLFNLIEKILGESPSRVNAQEREPMAVNEFSAVPPPLNPRLVALYDHVADRHSEPMPCKDGFLTERDCAVSCHRRHPYRFTALLPQALQLVEMVRSLGTSLLSAFEKGDAEYLDSLRSTYERQLLELALESKKNQVRESEWQVQGLEQGLSGALCRLNYYTTLIQNGLNSDEKGFDTCIDVTLASFGAATGFETTASADTMSPDEYIGSAGIEFVELSQIPTGSKLGQFFSILARVSNLAANVASTTGQQHLTHAEWTRRTIDWAQQVDVITIEIQELERQKLAADRRREISIRELNSHQQEIEHSVDVQNFVRDKFTKHDLYLFLQHETATLYRQAYDLAVDAASQTQRAFRYERRDVQRNFLPESAWNNLQEGLLAGERLELGLQTMAHAYMEVNCREYEITKPISLCMQFPASFLRLKTTGVCEIDIPEWMFDLDYPGHFMRRIKSVNLTIPCVTGPYIGIHCRLQLLSSCIRTEPYLVDSQHGRYEQVPNDCRFIRQYGATQGIATSNGQSDSGLFELSFNDERYLPFEFAGAVSCWRIELPPENNEFDLDTLTDVVMQLSYTAREGGEALRGAANKVAQQHLPASGWRLFDFARDFASAWSVYQDHKDEPSLGFPILLNRSMFPFLTGHRDLYIVSLEFFVVVRSAHVGEHLTIKYHGQDEEVKLVVCICDPDWLGLYHGSLKLRVGPIGSQSSGTLYFPKHFREICDVYMLCRYEAESRNPCEPKERAWEIDPWKTEC